MTVEHHLPTHAEPLHMQQQPATQQSAMATVPTCARMPGCPLLSATPEELERRAIIQRNDLLLHEAVIKNDTEGARRVLREPVDINCRNNYGRAPIHWASSRGNLEIMEMLIAANCDIEARDKYGMRPILMASWHGHRDAVHLLINTGACSNATNKDRLSLTDEELRHLLVQIKTNEDVVTMNMKMQLQSQSEKQYTLLMCAAKNNRLNVIEFLLDTLEDVNVDAVDMESQTALFHAAMEGHDTVVRKLVENGATLCKKNKDSRSALHVACERGHAAVVQYLLAREADMDARDVAGNAPLHIAAQNQQTCIVQLLLDSGATTDAENGKGSTPLHIASGLGCRGIVECLLQHGAQTNKQNLVGSTALHQACQTNEVVIVEILINKNADLNCLNERLQSPMHIAAEMGHTEICKLLLAAGANIEQREKGGRTALYIAARGSFTAIVDMIIKTARLDYPSEDPHHHHRLSLTPSYGGVPLSPEHVVIKPVLNTNRHKWRTVSVNSSHSGFDGGKARGGCAADATTSTSCCLRAVSVASIGSDIVPQPNAPDAIPGVIGSSSVDGASVGLLSTSWSPTRCREGERLRAVLYKLTYRQLGPGDWKRLAVHWAFTQEQIRAIEHQYTGPNSYKEHGFRMTLIWIHGLSADVNPIRELYESLTAIDKRNIADALRRKLDQENERIRNKNKAGKCSQCCIT